MASLTWRLLLGRRRWAALLLCNAAPPFVSWLFVLEEEGLRAAEQLEFIQILMATLVLTVLLPLASLIFGAMAVGQEIEDGTLAYSLAKPIGRWRLVAAKVVVAWLAAVVALLPGMWLAGWIVLGEPLHPIIRGFSVGITVAALLYTALFLGLSLFTRKALIYGLLYVIGWEGSLSRLFVGTRTLSIREYGTSISEALAHITLDEPFNSPLEPSTAVIMSVVVLAVVVALSVARLRGLELVEEI